MSGPVYFNGDRVVSLSTVLQRGSSRPVTGIRPLVIGAAYTDDFEFLAPVEWGSRRVFEELFLALPLGRAGWRETATGLAQLGEGHWRIVRAA